MNQISEFSTPHSSLKLNRQLGFYELLMSNDSEALEILYTLMDQIKALKDLKKFWAESIKVNI